MIIFFNYYITTNPIVIIKLNIIFEIFIIIMTFIVFVTYKTYPMITNMIASLISLLWFGNTRAYQSNFAVQVLMES